METNSNITVLDVYVKNNKIKLKNNGLVGIIDLKNIKNCKKLICSNNQITKLINIPDEIEYLDCSNNQITSLDFLPKKLQYLDCSHNKIKILSLKHNINIEKNHTSLILYGHWSYLKHVNCSYNNIEEITEFYYNLDYFNCKKNPIKKMFYPFDIKPLKYPSSLEEITFGYNFNQPLDNLPKNIKKIIFHERDEGSSHPHYYSNFNQSIDNLPEGLTYLKLESCFNNSVDKLPSTLKYLELGYNFNKTIDSLPSDLEELVISSKMFNYPVNNLPTGLKKLTLGFTFNQEVEFLPGLTYLKLGNEFNKPLDNLPNTLESLFLGDEFNNFIDNLPNKLKKLSIQSTVFNKSIDKIPDSIKYLKIGHDCSNNFKQRIHKLPKSLEIIEIYNKRFLIDETNKYNNIYDNDVNIFETRYYRPIQKNYRINNLENVIQDIDDIYYDNFCIYRMGEDIENISSTAYEKIKNGIYYEIICNSTFNKPIYNLENTNITKIEFGENFNQPLDFLVNTNVKYIKLGKFFNKSLDILKNTKVNYLEFYNCYNTLLKNIPDTIEFLEIFNKQYVKGSNKNVMDSVKKLKFSRSYQYVEPITFLPENLNELVFESQSSFFNAYTFNQPLNFLTNKLTHLTLGCYKFPLEKNMLPESLTYLKIDSGFNSEVDKTNLPKNLTYLDLGFSFNKSIDDLPDNITDLILGHSFNKPVDNLPINLKKIIVKKKEQLKLFNDKYKHMISIDE